MNPQRFIHSKQLKTTPNEHSIPPNVGTRWKTTLHGLSHLHSRIKKTEVFNTNKETHCKASNTSKHEEERASIDEEHGSNDLHNREICKVRKNTGSARTLSLKKRLHFSYTYNLYNYSRTLCIKCWVSAFHTQI